MFPRKLISGFALLSLTLMFLAACSSGDDNRTANVTNTNAKSNAAPATTPAVDAAPKAKLNVNTASPQDFLGAIPNLGNRMVHEFEEYRPYKSIQQFRKEIGKYVDEAKIAEYEQYVFVPIDENQSDAATLQQIPGIDATEAQELIAGRPYASRDAFQAKVREKVSADELAIATTYLVQR